MKLRTLIPTWMAVMSLGLVPAIPAFQAEDTTKAVTKKAKSAKQAAEPATSDTEKKATTVPLKTVPESEITAAKAEGKVWVNTDTGVYHKAGKWYGATKQGKFMTEQDAIKAGYRAAKTK
jgi:hypothetical protein